MKWYFQLGEDLRKIAIFFVGGGLAGWILDSDKVTRIEGFMLLSLGLVIWFTGIYLTAKEDESDG
ncbi:MAG: hypothetical protein V3W04_06640 [Gammaproteobacteria bacterium]